MFLFIHNYLTLRKWCYTPLQHKFALDPMILPFFKYLSRDYEKTTITAMYHGRWSFLSNTFCIISFCSDLSCSWNCLSCRICFISSSMWFVYCLRTQIIWHAALSSSHHAMRCCHHSVSITRSRLMVEKETDVAKW